MNGAHAHAHGVSPTAGYAHGLPTNPTAPPAKIKFREQDVDELMVLKMHQALAALDGPPPPGATIVLATGDGNKGWRVELYAWEEGLSREWMREFGEWTMPVAGEATGRFRVVGMEQFATELLEIY
ncbi:hypothetical protein B0H14DRAFT_3432977 [Mycena olivaceomarginata]|nr:hypothetical protein B0H14DRAFT_3432977 [Mycena olivaceomarginata]